MRIPVISNIRGLALLVLLPTSLTVCHAQRQWTLDECISYAIEHNINIQQRELDIKKSQVKLETSSNAWLPDVSANLGEQFSFGNYNSTTGSLASKPVLENNDLAYTTGDITATMNLFDGFKTQSQKRADRFSLDAATANLEKARKDIGIQIAVRYLECLCNKSMVDVALSQLEVSKKLCQRAATLVDEGKRPLSELKDVEASVASDEYTLAKAKGDLTVSLANLAQMLNLPTAEGFDVAPVENTSATSAALDYDGVIERWPSIVAAKSSIEANKAQLKVARSGYYPTLMFKGYIKTYYVNMFHTDLGWGGFNKQFFDSNLNEVVGLHLNIPIFNRFQTRSNIRSAKLNLLEQQLALDDARQNLRTEMQKASTNTKVALDKLEAAQKAVDAAAVSVSYEQERYEAGRSSVFDLINAQQKHLKASQDAVQAKYEYFIRQRILDFYQ